MAANRTELERIANQMFPTATVVNHLGTGGFACTFLVVVDDKPFALKILDPSLMERERVDRELTALQRVNHPSVVRFLGNGSYLSGGTDYRWIQMAFVEGRSLSNVFTSGEVFTPLEAIRLIRQIVAGAAAIWNENTAHRDLSPGNIIIRPDGSPVIVDLGLARHVEDVTYTALPTPGTPGWMSPEQVSSSPTHGDWKSDQFVIGALGYRLLTNVAPFAAPNLMDRWLMPATHVPTPIRAVDSSIPSVAADVIERMMAKQPHRRHLRAQSLESELDAAIAGLESSVVVDARPQHFLLTVGRVKNFAEGGFITALGPHALIIDGRSTSRLDELVGEAATAGALSVIDPVTHFARSPSAFRPAEYQALPYGGGARLVGFSAPADREAWCKQVLDQSLVANPDVVIAPYFFAGSGEMSWINESLDCADVYATLMSGLDADKQAGVWTGVAVHAEWLGNDTARDLLLTQLTGRAGMKNLYLLLATSQPSFAPLSDLETLRGLRDLLAVMREADISVIVGKRASSGLLLLALGAEGWSTGVSANTMNMSPHPEEEQKGGLAADRVYVPALLNLIALDTYVVMAASAEGHRVALDTPQWSALIAQNSGLDQLTTEQRVLLLQHNLLAQKSQVDVLTALPAGQRISRMQEWVAAADDAYGALPPTRMPSESRGFLRAWSDVLS